MTAQLPIEHQTKLYNQDFYLWIEVTTKILKEGRFAELDIDNLIEEMETMGRSEKKAVTSNLVVVLLHLLKWKYQPSKRSGSWQASIIEHRRRLQEDLQDSPSLKPFLREVFGQCYQSARKQAAAETGLSLAIFPLESPFTTDQVLDEDYFPIEN